MCSSDLPSGEMFAAVTALKKLSEEDESATQRVSSELKRTLVHYRMAIIILLFSTVLMATPLKWEDTQAWKRFFSRIFFFIQFGPSKTPVLLGGR